MLYFQLNFKSIKQQATFQDNFEDVKFTSSAYKWSDHYANIRIRNPLKRF